MIPLKISNLSKFYDQKIILGDISFLVEDRDIFGFVGLNGAGKTTLIKAVLGLISFDDGEITIYDVKNCDPKSRASICYLPEKFQPSQNISGSEFIDFANKFYDVKCSKDDIFKLCFDLDLDYNILKNKISTYSKGMTQKLGLISTFLSNAKLIILDEPMSGLDVVARSKLKKQIVRYQGQNKTIFLSSHILTDIEEICNKIAILHNNSVVFNGSCLDLMKKYNSNIENSFLKIVTD